MQSQTDSRIAYADLIKFAVSEGQTPGTELGDLPPGYAPLNAALVKTALAVSDLIRKGPVKPAPEPNTSNEVDPVITPTPEPTQQIIAAGMTPGNPDVPISASAIPFAIVLFLCSLLFYGLIRFRSFLVNPQRQLL